MPLHQEECPFIRASLEWLFLHQHEPPSLGPNQDKSLFIRTNSLFIRGNPSSLGLHQDKLPFLKASSGLMSLHPNFMRRKSPSTGHQLLFNSASAGWILDQGFKQDKSPFIRTNSPFSRRLISFHPGFIMIKSTASGWIILHRDVILRNSLSWGIILRNCSFIGASPVWIPLHQGFNCRNPPYEELYQNEASFIRASSRGNPLHQDESPFIRTP